MFSFSLPTLSNWCFCRANIYIILAFLCICNAWRKACLWNGGLLLVLWQCHPKLKKYTIYHESDQSKRYGHSICKLEARLVDCTVIFATELYTTRPERWSFCSWDQNMPANLDQNHGSWCIGSLLAFVYNRQVQHKIITLIFDHIVSRWSLSKTSFQEANCFQLSKYWHISICCLFGWDLWSWWHP